MRAMTFPLEDELRAERRQVVATMASLSDEEFANGRTLCSEWAPRDVLAHLIGIDDRVVEYVKALGRVRLANRRMVDRYASWSRERLLQRAERWAQEIAATTRPVSAFYLGDCAMHHQDVLRGLGKEREVPDASADAILREGLLLGGARRLLTHRIIPTDGGRPLGRGPEVRGTREALGMWLGGRSEVAAELQML